MNAEVQYQGNSQFPTGEINVKSEPEPEQPPSAQQELPPSEWTTLRRQVEDNPYNEAAWNALIDKAEESGELEKVKETYEALLEKYPNTSSAQISYLNHFLTNQSQFPFAESLFARFLRTSPSVDLWKFYIVYVRRVNTGPATRDTVRKAYEFALSHVGQDKDSGDVWGEYIQFVKSGETATTWEEQQKMDALRKIYQRAVQIPLENVEILWKDYEAFENGLNKITAKKFMQDLMPAFVQARQKLRELRKFLGPLLPPGLPSGSSRPALSLPHKPTYSQADRALAGAWKQYLKWEEGNPLELEDKGVLMARLQGVYRKAVIRMRFFSEIWFMAYTWTASVGRQDDALAILKAGIEANPTNFVLNFALAESQELGKNFSEVHATFNRLLQGMQGELEAIDAKIAASNANTSFSSGDAAAPAPGSQETHIDTSNGVQQPDSGLNTNGSGIPRDASFATQKTSSSSSSNDLTPHAKELRERRQEYGLVWILYIRFALRSEGVEASRKVFGVARKDKWTPWEVFEAVALMEYHVAKQLPVASKILALTHTKFPDEIDFIVRYLTFLMSINDENNARALFERAVTNFPPERARPLWERWARYEYQYGDLEAALKLEKRMAEAYPNDPPIKRFAQRHSYSTIDGIANRDLGFSLSRQSAALTRTDTIPAITVGAPGITPNSAGLGSLQSQAQIASSSTTTPIKRQNSPDRSLRENLRTGPSDGYSHNYGHGHGQPPHKRTREISPPPRERDRERDRDRDRWSGPSNRRYGSPAWERDRERERSPPRRANVDRDEPLRQPGLPQVLNYFVGTLPPPSSFDGPVFRTDDLMQLFRNAVIPGSNQQRPRSPPPPPRPARPPPDYGPYRGPGGGRGGRY